MVKTYRAIGTIICLNIYENGVNYNIEFAPVSSYNGVGGSSYTTDNPDIQNGIEHDPMFGQRIFIENKNGELTTETNQVDVVEATPVKEYNHVKVGGLADAKAWLVENLGIKSSSIRTKRQVLEVAEEHSVAFDGLE